METTPPSGTKPRPISQAEYVETLRPLLPPEAFSPDAQHLVRIALHLFIALAGYLVLRAADAWWVMLPTSLAIGHSMACLLFLAHDVSHNSVVRGHLSKRGLELLLWGLNAIPPTLWHRLHNQTHHAETNTVRDPDRAFRASENTPAVRAYNRLLFPNRMSPSQHPFVLFHFVTYIVGHTVTALLPGRAKPSTVTFKPHYTTAHRLEIAVELAFIGLAQLGIWWLMKSDWHCYLFAVPIPLFAASAVTMAYVWTNHLLKPLCEHSDPLASSTSVIVPHWVDWLHDNFSYHTEHHVFPGMNPRYYPEVSRLLKQHFPDRYHRISFGEAWRRIWEQEEFIREDGFASAKLADHAQENPPNTATR